MIEPLEHDGPIGCGSCDYVGDLIHWTFVSKDYQGHAIACPVCGQVFMLDHLLWIMAMNERLKEL